MTLKPCHNVAPIPGNSLGAIISMRRSWLLAAFFCAVYLSFILGTLWLMQTTVGWRRTHIVAHAVMIALTVSLALLPYVVIPTRLLRSITVFLLSAAVFVQTLTMLGSLVANQFIHQNISLELVLSNSAIIFDFAPVWAVVLFLGLLALWAYTIAGSIMTVVFGSEPRRFGRFATVALLVVSLGLLTRLTPLHFSQEPMANFFGYPGFAVLQGSFKERIDQELALAKSYQPGSLKQPSNIVVLMVESLSTKHFPLLGYERATMPNLEKITNSVADYRVYGARSTCSDSICGIVSTLTSRGILDFASGRALKLSDVLKAHGYRTNLLLASDHEYDPLLNFFFKDSADYRYDKNHTDTPLNSDDIILEGLQQVPDFDGQPNFFFMFLFSTHQAGEKKPEFQRYQPVITDETAYRSETTLAASEITGIQNLYDNRVLQLDAYIQDIWSSLESKGYLEDALVMIIGDHGEAIAERGYYGHGMHLYEPFVLTPWVLLSTQKPLPKPAPRMVRQIDMAPTVLEYLDVPVPSFWDGLSMYREQGPAETYHEFGVRLRLRGLSCDALVLDNPEKHKYMRCQRGKNPMQRYFYALASDPEEVDNLIDTLGPEEQARLDQLLDARHSQ